jgi:hypothetical protein
VVDTVIRWDFRTYDDLGVDGPVDANGNYQRSCQGKELAIGFERLVVANT